MISRRLAAALIAAPAALCLAACASSTVDGSGGGAPTGSAGSSSTSSAPSSSSAPTGASSSASGSMPTDARGLYALMIAAAAKTRTSHLEFTISTAGQSFTGVGDEKLTDGKVTAMKIKESLPGSTKSIEIILVDGKIYAQLPTQINTTGKPYLLITSSSSDATVRQLATSLRTSLDTASASQYAVFAQAADEFTLVGPATSNGLPATRYSMTISPSKLPPDYQGKAALVASGLTSIPVQIVVDHSGRILEIDENFTVQGKKIVTKVTASRYDQPVSITAPPASQVGVK